MAELKMHAVIDNVTMLTSDENGWSCYRVSFFDQLASEWNFEADHKDEDA
jgi:hypothetical protein